MSQWSSTVLLSTTFTKTDDPGRFTLPCQVGSLTIGETLVDLGANINLMPSFIYKQLHDHDLKPTQLSLQLVDRFQVHRGKL